MNLKEGDLISGHNVAIGKYMGIGEVDGCAGTQFHRIYDMQKEAIHYIPLDKLESVRKLPAKSTVMKNLEIFKIGKLIDSGEIEGSRYQYFSQKLAKQKFKNEIEVFHDLTVLKEQKGATIGESKLWNSLKERLVFEMTFVLSCKKPDVEKLLQLSQA
ncbi:MAG: hypothetical protein HN509_11285 [Halobacteriovoraceae bacterium]|jgi:RNA polymerase-interacting CarD/CdnL/TRCF family regulator|nr:hypothetical protein [Halobacteriovoraceae bacterium]MBT5096154.1 hypothetical protein [Halobacteriovoraceae bacterium]